MLPNMPRGGLGRCQQHEGDRQQEPHRGLRGADYLAFPAAKANGPVGVSHSKMLSTAFPLIYFAMEPHGRMTRVSAQAASASKLLPGFLRRCPWHRTRVTLA